MTEQLNSNKLNDLCPSCFERTNGANFCEVCGYNLVAPPEEDWNKLGIGTVLLGRYLIGRTLGQGGFGITYLGFDTRLGTKLAIKEYYPSGLAVRNTGDKTVMLASRDVGTDFKEGLEKFLEEARTLARFDQHPNIVSVRDFFEQNGTAYMVMNYLEGKTMLQYLKEKGGKISFQEATNLLFPVMDALDTVHASGLIHRDISPDNVFISNDGQVRLLDFGAAKSAMALVNQQSHSIVLKKGYSPAEQYQSKGSLGPWTDVYSMAATLYRSITGELPPDSIDRFGADILIPPSNFGVAIPGYAEQAIIRALSLSPQARFQCMSDFRAALSSVSAANMAQMPPVDNVVQKKSSDSKDIPKPLAKARVSADVQNQAEKVKNYHSVTPVVVAIFLLACIGGGGVYYFMNSSSSSHQSTAITTPKNGEGNSTNNQTTKESDTKKTPFEVLRDKAKAGDKEAQYKVGTMLQQGKGVQQDTIAAAEWLRKSAQQGYSPAQNDLGTLYIQGLGVPQDYKEGAKWLSLAADQGNPYAQANLGWLYDNGQGVPENKAKAFSLYKAAADQGHANAQANLAYMYENGIGGATKNLKIAAQYYEKSAEQGVTNAQYMIGIYYEKGIGVPKNINKAIQWLKKAAAQGDMDAANRLKSIQNTSNPAAKKTEKPIKTSVKPSETKKKTETAKTTTVKKTAKETAATPTAPQSKPQKSTLPPGL